VVRGVEMEAVAECWDVEVEERGLEVVELVSADTVVVVCC
jgi:hypothetical protein